MTNYVYPLNLEPEITSERAYCVTRGRYHTFIPFRHAPESMIMTVTLFICQHCLVRVTPTGEIMRPKS